MPKLRRYQFSPDALVQTYQEGTTRQITAGFPDDAEIIRCGYDETRDLFWITVKSEQFSEVGVGESIPTQKILMKLVERTV